ncbi:hypothetical protein LKM02_26970, partial [Bacillus cereus]|uniref:hypothetical protein n=2 Tax=Bacillus cereus TaxID=1396 RepID=UPI001D0E861F
KTAPPIVSYLSNKLGAVQSRVVLAFLYTEISHGPTYLLPMTTPAPVRIPYTNLITNIATILSPPPFFKMEEMTATPTSYSLLSYVFIVLCFKIGNKIYG